ncbi:MAG TPA: hypothetical protein DGG94_21915 [Micromonosporaceae bacterium]|nr:hypothetical protein [Micromonosporaceae bacterium]HCU52416.1 hypothetical protein [Micromonosporaceae bacterium]
MTNARENAPVSAEELTEEIESTRAALGDTVAALAAKADVKARLTDSAVAAKEMIAETGSEIATGLSHRAGQMTGAMERLTGHIRRNPLPWLIGTAVALVALIARRSRGR